MNIKPKAGDSLQYRQVFDAVYGTSDYVSHGSVLSRAAKIRAAADELIAREVAEVRNPSDGGSAMTWAAIGKALGVTFQAAQKRYGGKS